jgi:hypothetical protein
VEALLSAGAAFWVAVPGVAVVAVVADFGALEQSCVT